MTEWIVTSSAIILIVIALRGLLKGKISLKLQYGLWALVLVRLLLPFSIVDSAISVSNILSAPAIREADSAVTDYRESYEAIRQDAAQRGEAMTDEDIRLQVQQDLFDRTYSKVQQDLAQSGTPAQTPEVQTELQTEVQHQVEIISLTAVITEILPYFWVAGMIAVAAALVGSNLHFGWKLRQSRKAVEIPGVPLNTYLTDYVATPCLFGLVKPDIYLTSEVMTDSQMRRHVIAHEMSHYRQGDHIWSVLRCLCLVLHWYNPLVWIAAVLSKKDAELACDEATIKALGETERTAYGRTLIGMTCVRRDPGSLMLTATTMLGTKKTLKERIALIARKPKTALYTLVACVLVAALAVGCTFTGAPAQTEEEKLLDRCREAVEYIQNLKHFEIIEHYEKIEESDYIVGADTQEARYVHSGDDWYHFKSDGDWTWRFLNKNGQQYRKDITNAVPEDDIPAIEWTQLDLSENLHAKHAWIMDIHWDEESIGYLTYTGNGDGYEGGSLTPFSVTSDIDGDAEKIRIEFEPGTENVVNDEDAEGVIWILTFRIDRETGIVTEVTREIVIKDRKVHVAGINGGTEYIDFRSTSTLSIYSGTEEEMSDIIDDIFYGEIVTVVPTPDDPTEPPTTEPTEPVNRYEWEPAVYESLTFREYFEQERPIETVTVWLSWTAADGETKYAVDYGLNGLFVERLESPNPIVWRVPNSKQYGGVGLILCDGVYVYGIENTKNLIRIDLKTGLAETIFTAEQFFCGYTADGSCKNIFIVDRDWLYFLAKNGDYVSLYRIQLSNLTVEEISTGARSDTLPMFLNLNYHSEDSSRITCTYLNPELQKILLNEINDPNSSYRDITVRVGAENVALDWVWKYREAFQLDSNYRWYGPFEYLRIQLQNDKNIPGSVMVNYNAWPVEWDYENVWVEMPENTSSKPVNYKTNITKFQELLTYENGYWYWRAMGCVFERPSELNLEYLFYNGMPAEQGDTQNSDPTGLNPYSDSEVEFLRDYALEKFGDESVWVNAHKLPREAVNDVLVTYFGVTLDTVSIPEDWAYFEETEAYYDIRFDGFGVTEYTITDVQTDSDGFVYVYWTTERLLDTRYQEIVYLENPQMVMILKEKADGGYGVLMNASWPDLYIAD